MQLIFKRCAVLPKTININLLENLGARMPIITFSVKCKNNFGMTTKEQNSKLWFFHIIKGKGFLFIYSYFFWVYIWITNVIFFLTTYNPKEREHNLPIHILKIIFVERKQYLMTKIWINAVDYSVTTKWEYIN